MSSAPTFTARVAIDGMGGDHAPEEIVAGVVESTQRLPSVQHILTGPSDRLQTELARHGPVPANLKIEHASEVVGMGEHPVEALRGKPDSSIRKALRLVKHGEADAAFSAGNTGAMVAGASIGLGLLPGVKRPGIAVPMPTERGAAALIDAGANPHCKAIHLLQYAVMGSMYIKCLDPARQKPAVGLLNIGEEVGKGNEVVKEAYTTLKASALNFRGNVEGHRIFGGEWDVIVCDGFVGNTMLKLAEGLSAFLVGKLMNGMGADAAFREKVGKAYEMMDYSFYGGAPLLGVNGIILIGHGRSRALAITNAVKTAADFVERRMNDQIVEELKKLSWWGRLWDTFRTKPLEEGELP